MADADESQIFLSVVFGLLVLLVALYVFFFNKKKTEEDDVVEENKAVEKKNGEVNPKTKPNNKKLPEKKQKKKIPISAAKDNGANHPMLITSLKGHTGIINSLDFSTNGKILASCSEGKNF